MLRASARGKGVVKVYLGRSAEEAASDSRWYFCPVHIRLISESVILKKHLEGVGNILLFHSRI